MKFIFSVSLLLMFALSISCQQQEKLPFIEEIEDFRQQDAQQMPPKGATLFVGSSSIKMWDSIDLYFPGQQVIRRGFGGSGLLDAIRYADDIIIPYQPKQVVIYTGDNDIATGTVTAQEVFQRFETLFQLIRQKLPDTRIIFVSIKPSPSREQYMPVMLEANMMIRRFLSGYPETAYVDVFHPMLDDEGKPREELFLDDRLHMKPEGYRIWAEAIRPHLQ